MSSSAPPDPAPPPPMLSDDLPWPELGNVSRGATRGNQGQKGVLSAPDAEGRCLLQLRVQPGVLTVLLNRTASDWYRRLDAEVNHALKLTKTYWRKARRRQDYDAVADQDHMELHEWLQQLKDKVMSHLELLMQRGDIKGPPYVMPDGIELAFLRKFIERQQAGIPHNPRLRKAFHENRYVPAPRPSLADSETPEPSDDSGRNGSDAGWADDDAKHFARESAVPRYPQSAPLPHSYIKPPSPHLGGGSNLEEEAESSKRLLHAARIDLRRAQKETQDAFARYTASLEAERRAWQEVVAVEDRRDSIVSLVLRQTQTQAQQRPPEAYARKPFGDDTDLPRYSQYSHHTEYQLSAARPSLDADLPPPLPSQQQQQQSAAAPSSLAQAQTQMRSTYTWDDERYPLATQPPQSQSRSSASSASAHNSPRTATTSPAVSEPAGGGSPGRKHARAWDQADEGTGMLPPRKRSNHGSPAGQAQTLGSSSGNGNGVVAPPVAAGAQF
ncbi:hypothetical protein DENSPDRAFT_877093 [Dentipellis sp. KUC8613]|nr:hypothetical protein DENSPDRAFT_877093 [Dentipellis sp. KUC8613]